MEPENTGTAPLPPACGRVGDTAEDTAKALVQFQEKLLCWFETEKRDFPWRTYQDPYATLIAEKLLQQTAARPITVSIYNEFLEKYPTALALASANVIDIEN